MRETDLVMQHHDFYDEDTILKVILTHNKSTREIVFKESDVGSVILSKEDIITFAKEFDLLVFNKGSEL